jgi:hypothetical protein
LKIRVGDTLGCGIAAFDERPVRICREIAQSVQGTATIIGTTRKTFPDLAAFANGAAGRYYDLNTPRTGHTRKVLVRMAFSRLPWSRSPNQARSLPSMAVLDQ